MFPDINDYFYAVKVSPSFMDRLWAEGWRHFGALFFRYSRFIEGDKRLTIIPVRVNVSSFRLSKSQRRIYRKNRDLDLKIQPVQIDETRERLFELHKTRFKTNPPSSLDVFLGGKIMPGFVCEMLEFSLWFNDKLIAASYLDIGSKATSSVYAMFDPAFSRRSLGIYTMLLEIEFSKNNGFNYYYHGYASLEPSVYDYKKCLSGLEYYDWKSEKWKTYEEGVGLNYG